MTEAVAIAVNACIKDGVLKDYLQASKAEVAEMLITEYDEAKTMRQLKDEYLEEGRAEGREEGWEAGRRKIVDIATSLIREGTLTLQKAITSFELTDDEVKAMQLS